MADLQYVIVDCFTRNTLEGNALAVFLDGRGLSTETMQKLAKETNLSETTFILPGEGKDGAHRVRIFTVDEELPFAGHPTLGTAAVLREQHGGNEVSLDLNVGRVPVRYEQREGAWFGEMRQRDPEFLAVHDLDEVARATGLAASDIDSNLPIQTVSTGLPFTIVPVKTLEALQRLNLEWSRAKAYLDRSNGNFFYFLARGAVNPSADMHVRMIFYNGEDPATGSAAGCGAAWMVKYGVAKPGQKVAIEQGVECRRPSRLIVSADRDGDRITDVRVGGTAIAVIRGELTLPA